MSDFEGVNFSRGRDEDLRRQLRASTKWKKLRGVFLRAHPVCKCGAPATRVDHKLGHGPGWERRFFDRTNLEAMCESCHNRKTMTFDAKLRGFGSAGQTKLVNRGPSAMDLALSQLKSSKKANGGAG